MRHIMIIAIIALAATVLLVVSVGGESERGFSPYVDTQGNIRIPEDYREWAFVGSWHIEPQNGGGSAAGFHNVYTQAETVKAYRETGRFPDGSVLVKELLKTDRGQLTTGKATWATDIEGWFVMVKDSKGRFPNSPLWGEGWGWVLFSSDDPENTVTRDWRKDCRGCHTPARTTDWVFVDGYPVLRRVEHSN